jgi:hypothetical protein
MKQISIIALIGCLLLTIPAAAQEETPPCTPDLIAVRELLDQVEVFTSAGNSASALTTMKTASEQLNILIEACTPRLILNLTERLVVRNGQLTLNYPENWLREITADSPDAVNPTYVQFANSINVFNSANTSVPVLNPGDQLIVLIFGAPETIVSGSELTPSAEGILISFQQTVLEGSDAQGFRFGEIELLSINDRRAATVNFSNTTFDAQAYAVEIQSGTTFAVLLALSAPGELDDLSPAALEMAASISYDPAAVSATPATPEFVPSPVPSPTP